MTKKQPKRKPRPGVDEYGRKELHHAAVSGDLEKVRALIASGADINAQDDNGFTALHFAAQENKAEIVDFLLQHNANLEIPDAHGNAPLFRAVFSYRGDGRTIQILLKAGADPDHLNSSGISPRRMAHTIANYDVRKYF
jgi:ankyrin repeat protein